MQTDWTQDEKTLAGLIIIGLLIALAKELTNPSPTSYRMIFGRVIVTTANTLMAGAFLLDFTQAPMVAILGLGAFLGSLGTEVLQLWLRIKFGIDLPKGNENVQTGNEESQQPTGREGGSDQAGRGSNHDDSN